MSTRVVDVSSHRVHKPAGGGRYALRAAATVTTVDVTPAPVRFPPDRRIRRTLLWLSLGGSVLGLVGCLCGLFVFTGPYRIFGCGLSRPSGITAADLVGDYRSTDGGRIVLLADGTFIAAGMEIPGGVPVGPLIGASGVVDPPPLSGPGTWQLEPPGGSGGDVAVAFTAPPPGFVSPFATTFGITGSRGRPVLYIRVGPGRSCDAYLLNRS
jgi:hypothetical protein